MRSLELHQVVHGYRAGHHSLASSIELTAAEDALLGRLSDLAGHLPSGVRFESYHTGYPCGRFYAFARTWLDDSAPRGGAVLTHTLLIALDDVGTLDTVFAIASGHHKPDAAALDAFRAPVTVEPTTQPPAESDVQVIAEFFGTTHPVWRLASAPVRDSVVNIWSHCSTTQRARMAFCTFCFSPRRLDDGRLFDLMVAPPEARAEFERLPRLRSRPPWAQQLASRPQMLADIQRDWDRPLARGQLPALIRLLELRVDAPARLTAARSAADMLQQLDPHATHAWWPPIIEALVDHQASAPMEPKPLWDLVDLLERPALQRHRPSRLEAVVHTEAVRRLSAHPETAIHQLNALYTACSRLDPPIGLLPQLATLELPLKLVQQVVEMLAPELATTLLRTVPQRERARLLKTIDTPRAHRIAEELGDTEVAAALWPEEQLDAFWAWLEDRPEAWSGARRRDPLGFVRWGISRPSDPRLAREVAQGVRDLRWSPEQLADTAIGAANGSLVCLEFVLYGGGWHLARILHRRDDAVLILDHDLLEGLASRSRAVEDFAPLACACILDGRLLKNVASDWLSSQVVTRWCGRVQPHRVLRWSVPADGLARWLAALPDNPSRDLAAVTSRLLDRSSRAGLAAAVPNFEKLAAFNPQAGKDLIEKLIRTDVPAPSTTLRRFYPAFRYALAERGRLATMIRGESDAERGERAFVQYATRVGWSREEVLAVASDAPDLQRSLERRVRRGP